MATIDDVCSLSGVSRSTVKRFLAGQQVRGQNAKKIKNAMKELGYRTDKLVEKRNCTIEIIGGPDDANPFFFQGFSEMFVNMIKTLEKGGATVLIQPGNAKYIPRADGIILYGLLSDREDEIISILKSRGIPFVCAYREIEKSGVSFVTCDNYHAAYEMTQLLIDEGHTKIVVCGGDGVSRNMAEKLQAFKDCMAANKLRINSKLINPVNSESDTRKFVNNLLDSGEEFTAFFGLRDRLSLAFVDEVTKRGYKIPDDFSVVGMDSTGEALVSKPKLTSVAIPFAEIGKEAAETIFELIDNPGKVCIRKYLKYDIVRRESL
ncbi:MAG: LacI family DNA-binding transcriptional regulator [Clostridia bacterium]|nr:LacI family DNA-binding transcriptional regulator [Clostridia bacterium]